MAWVGVRRIRGHVVVDVGIMTRTLSCRKPSECAYVGHETLAYQLHARKMRVVEHAPVLYLLPVIFTHAHNQSSVFACVCVSC